MCGYVVGFEPVVFVLLVAVVVDARNSCVAFLPRLDCPCVVLRGILFDSVGFHGQISVRVVAIVSLTYGALPPCGALPRCGSRL